MLSPIVENTDQFPTIEAQIAELKAAGWIPKTPTVWKTPNGALWLGPHGAWKAMRRQQANPFPPIHCECGEVWTQEMHTVCPNCARWPKRKERQT